MSLAAPATRLAAREEAAPRRLLLVNPNGNPAVNALVRAAADRALAHAATAEVVNPADSPWSIESPADRAAAEPRALALLAAHPGYDAYVLACFDDIALAPARRLVRAPVVGTVEASLALARTMSDRILILTTVAAAIPGIEALLDRYGAAAICRVEAARIGVAEAAERTPEIARRLAAALRAARERTGADLAILGSAGLSGWARPASETAGIPVIDPVEAAVRMGLAAASQGTAATALAPG